MDDSHGAPWKSHVACFEPPRDLGDAERRLRHMDEVQAHREWLIEELRQHVANLEEALECSRRRILDLEEHSANLEDSLAARTEHACNLERLLEDRERRLADLEGHVANLERRLPVHRARLSERGILSEEASPGLLPLFRAGNALWESRPDLQARFPADRAADFWYWLLWHGPSMHESSEDLFPPAPPKHLMRRVVGSNSSAQAYRRSGLVDWWRLEEGLREGGFDPAQGGRLLDFGVGCGRILQGFAVYSARCKITGVDVDAEAIQWCRSQLDFARFATLPRFPPAEIVSSSFDAIYAFSVFSHLPEDLHRRWLEELARLAAPGAVVAITVQGWHVVHEMERGRGGEDPSLCRDLRKRRSELEDRGFLFVPYRTLRFDETENSRFFESWDLDAYGNTFIAESYVRAHWSDLFEILGYYEAPDDWQDLVVLRRR